MVIFWTLTIVLVMLGFFTGYLIPMTIPANIFPYLTILFLSLLDTLFYSMRFVLEGAHSGGWRILLRLLFELVFGSFLIFFGDQSGLDLYLVAVIPLGASVFFSFQALFTHKPQTTS